MDIDPDLSITTAEKSVWGKVINGSWFLL